MEGHHVLMPTGSVVLFYIACNLRGSYKYNRYFRANKQICCVPDSHILGVF